MDSEPTRLLPAVEQPTDLRSLDAHQRRQLAQEIRDELAARVNETGGHFSSNLGVVELTIALHTVFNSPWDSIVWDVGHQAYVHKLLTGRGRRLGTIRQHGGLSPFCDRDESVHDAFGAGHAGTSLSAALGMAVARDLQGEDRQVVAVIGDGAMTCGMPYEAMNNAGAYPGRFIVVLNDNGMSISPNVGAISNYLDGRQPAAGRSQATLWEELGFRYLGPVEGHNTEWLIAVLSEAAQTDGPVLVHVLTEKGKGYGPAEADPVGLHGVSPGGLSKSASAPTKSSTPSYQQVFTQAAIDLAERDARVVTITAAMAEGTGLSAFARRFPNRFFDVGIAEGHAVTFAAGLASAGMRPIVDIYSSFLQRAYDSVVHDVCIQRLPVIFALDRAGLVGEDGRTHHGMFDLSYLRCIPNMTVMAPKDENELRQMLFAAAELNGPVAIRFPRGSGLGVPIQAEPDPLRLGRSEILRRGKDICLLALGSMVAPALSAADELAKLGVSAGVINARFVKPLDRAAILSVARRYPRLVTLEEHVLLGGFGSAVLELLSESRMASAQNLLRIGLPDAYVEHGSQKLLRELYGLSTPAVVQAIQQAWPELSGSQAFHKLSA